MIARGYTLDLYCDIKSDEHEYKEFPHQFTGETWGETSREAKGYGWILYKRTSQAICPKCAKAGKRLT